jgi:glycosyltransferase involved in cell wall biosynthesis
MIHWFYPPEIGGVETIMQNVCRELVKRGENAIVLASSSVPREENDCGVAVYRTPLLRTGPIVREECAELYEFMREFIADNEIDVLHLHNFHLSQGIHQAITIHLAAESAGIPAILHLHGRVVAELEKFIVRNVGWDKILSVSRWVENQVVSREIKDKCRVIYNGVDTERFCPQDGGSIRRKLGLREEKIIYCPSRIIKTIEGELEERKGVPYLLEAAGILKKDFGMRDFLLLLTGIGTEECRERTAKALSDLERKAESYGIGENLLLHRFPWEDMPLAYAASDVVVLPSWNEPCSVVILEGLASGKVVVGGASGGTPELIKDGVTGYLFEPRNSRELAELLMKIFRNEEESREIAENARKSAEREFSQSVFVDRLLDVYKEVISTK